MLTKTLKLVLPPAVIVGAVLVAWALVQAAAEPQPRPKERRVPIVRVAPARLERVRLVVETYGSVRPRTEISIVPQVAGRVVFLAPSFREGAFFEEGEVLIGIERRDYELAVTQAEAIVAQAQARLDREEAEAKIARDEWEKYGKEYGKEPNALVLREPQLAEARAGLASAEARLEKAKLDLTRTEITAPCDGRVRTKSVEVGQFLMTGAPVGMVYATDYAEVRLSIPDHQLGYVDLPLDHSEEGAPTNGRGGAPVPVAIHAVLGGREFEWRGELVRPEAEVDPRTRVIHCVARLENPYAPRSPGQPLLVGMYVRAEIPGRDVECVVVPRSALRGRDRVIVVDAEQRLRLRRVEVFRKEGEVVLLTSGLETGERVCVTEVHPFLDGMEVRVAEEEGDR